MRMFVHFGLILGLLTACGGQGSLRRSIVGNPTCEDDNVCAVGALCVDGYCQAPLSPLQAVPDLRERSSTALLEAIGQSPFASAKNGAFTLKFSVSGAPGSDLKDAVDQAKLRARFVDGGVRLWGLELDAKGGPVTVPTSNGDRIYFVTDVRVRSENEIFVPLVDGDFPRATASATMKLTISAAVGANETDTIRLTAELENVECKLEFTASPDDRRLHARIVVAELRELYGLSGSPLSIGGLGADADLLGAVVPERWLQP